MSEYLHAMTSGTNGALLSYATVLIPMLVGLRQGRARIADFLRGVVLAVPVMLISWLVMSLAGSALVGLGMRRGSLAHMIVTFAGIAAIGYVAGRFVASRGRSSDSAHRRGAVVMETQPARSYRPSQGARQPSGGTCDPNTPIRLAGLPVALEDETKHFKFIGTTGTGKSTAIRQILSTALGRGDRVVIADPDGGYLNHFYDSERGDVILSPFEPGAAKWNLLGEIANDYDVEQIARSLIPDSGGDQDRIWSEYARTFFSAVVLQAFAGGIKEDAEVYRLLISAPVEELKLMLAGTAAGPFLADGSEKMFGSLRSVTTSAVRALKYTTRQQGIPFSVRNWVRAGAARQAGGHGGALFLPYKAGEIAALRSTISAWMRMAIFEAMDRDEGDQRLWFIVDELDALGEIDGLKDALARLRKFGGRCVLGFQSIAQVSGTYGRGTADTIVENCGNTLILRCSASEHGGTSEFASKLIGQREVMHTTQSRTRNPSSWTASVTTSQHLKIEPAVMASEVERLADLEGYLKFASKPDWRRVRLTPVNYPVVVRLGKPVSGASTEEQSASAQPAGKSTGEDASVGTASNGAAVPPGADASNGKITTSDTADVKGAAAGLAPTSPIAPTGPVAAGTAASASPTGASRRTKAQGRPRKRIRRPKAATTQAPAAPGEASGMHLRTGGSGPTDDSENNGAIENRGGGAE